MKKLNSRVKERGGGRVVTELDSASKGLGTRPSWSQCVVFMGTLLYSTPRPE